MESHRNKSIGKKLDGFGSLSIERDFTRAEYGVLIIVVWRLSSVELLCSMIYSSPAKDGWGDGKVPKATGMKHLASCKTLKNPTSNTDYDFYPPLHLDYGMLY
jgi:hypothetical protein